MTASNDVRTDRRYTKDHEWAKQDGAEVRVGITAFAVDQLGDITLVNLDIKVGDTIAAGQAFGTIESVKTLSDLFAPVGGKVSRINTELESQPELINADCYENGWMLALTPSDANELEDLLDSSAYVEVLKTAAH